MKLNIFGMELDVNISDVKEYRHFTSEKEALIYVNNLADDDCVDNYRIGYVDDEQSIIKYEDAQGNGCCGSIDILCTINNKLAFLGCNYGH